MQTEETVIYNMPNTVNWNRRKNKLFLLTFAASETHRSRYFISSFLKVIRFDFNKQTKHLSVRKLTLAQL